MKRFGGRLALVSGGVLRQGAA